MSEYVGFKIGALHEHTELSEYYCARCGYPVTDHDSYCRECGGAFQRIFATEPCDRDALLRLARYMDKDVAETEAHFSNVVSTKSVSDYARRIREACGEVER